MAPPPLTSSPCGPLAPKRLKLVNDSTISNVASPVRRVIRMKICKDTNGSYYSVIMSHASMSTDSAPNTDQHMVSQSGDSPKVTAELNGSKVSSRGSCNSDCPSTVASSLVQVMIGDSKSNSADHSVASTTSSCSSFSSEQSTSTSTSGNLSDSTDTESDQDQVDDNSDDDSDKDYEEKVDKQDEETENRDIACHTANLLRGTKRRQPLGYHSGTGTITRNRNHLSQMARAIVNGQIVRRAINSKKKLSSPLSLVKEYVCDFEQCGQVFANSTNLRRHRVTIHLGHKPYRCLWAACEFFGKVRYDVIRHVRTVHFRLPSSVKQQMEQGIEEQRDANSFVAEDPAILAKMKENLEKI